MEVAELSAGDMVLSGRREVKVDSVFVDANGEIGILVPDAEGGWWPSRVKPSELTARPTSVTVTIDGKQVTVEKPAAGETVTRAIWPGR